MNKLNQLCTENISNGVKMATAINRTSLKQLSFSIYQINAIKMHKNQIYVSITSKISCTSSLHNIKHDIRVSGFRWILFEKL